MGVGQLFSQSTNINTWESWVGGAVPANWQNDVAPSANWGAPLTGNPAAIIPTGPQFNQTNLGGILTLQNYIWQGGNTAYFRTSFQYSGDSCETFLWQSFADNWHNVYINGTLIGGIQQPNNWPNPLSQNIDAFINCGTNYIHVMATNDQTGRRWFAGNLTRSNGACCQVDLATIANNCTNYSFAFSTSNVLINGLRWTVNGQAIPASDDQFIYTNTFAPGTHVVCVDYIGLGGQLTNGSCDDEICCSQLCETIIVPEEVVVASTDTTCELPFLLSTSLATGGSSNFQWYLNGSAITGANQGVFNANLFGDYELQFLDPNGCPVKELITLIEDCPCAIDTIQSQAVYQKRIFNGSSATLRTVSAIEHNNNLYTIHQQPVSPTTTNNSFILTVQDMATGSLVQSYEYFYAQGEGQPNNFFAKEIKIVPESFGQDAGIYVLGNTDNGNNIGDNSRAGSGRTGALLHIDFSFNLVTAVSQETVVNPTEKLSNVYYNAFSPVYKNGSFDGWIIVGAVRQKANSHYIMMPVVLRTGPDGYLYLARRLTFSIPCPTCDANANQVESNWAVDISDQVDIPGSEFAILLDSRSHFMGIAGHINNTAKTLRTSYILVDAQNLYFNYAPFNGIGGSLTWWNANASPQFQMNSRKIIYESKAGVSNIKIVGHYTDWQRGFIHEFSSTSMVPYSFNAANSLELPETFGLVDFTKVDNKYYALGAKRVFEFDNNLNLTNQSNRILHSSYTTSDFHYSNNYIGGLIRGHQDGGVVINDIRSQTIVKTNSFLEMTCEDDTPDIPIEPSNPAFAQFDYMDFDLELSPDVLSFQRIDISFEEECCSENEFE